MNQSVQIWNVTRKYFCWFMFVATCFRIHLAAHIIHRALGLGMRSGLESFWIHVSVMDRSHFGTTLIAPSMLSLASIFVSQNSWYDISELELLLFYEGKNSTHQFSIKCFNNNNNLFRIPTSPKCFSVGSCRNYVTWGGVLWGPALLSVTPATQCLLL